MNDSLLFQQNIKIIDDTVLVSSAIANDTITQNLGNFFQTSNIQIKPIAHFSSINYDYITYVIFALLGIISIIWYLLPEKFLTIFSIKSINKVQRDSSSTSSNLGIVLSSFFWLNFIISTSFFIIMIIKKLHIETIYALTNPIVYILITLTSLFIYRFLLTHTTAFVFRTQQLMKQQIIIDRNVQLISGIILLPIILLIIYTEGTVILYFAMSIFTTLQAYRIIQIAIIGKTSTVFSVFHIFLYLCTLEIVPIVVLIGIINNYPEIFVI